MARLSIGAFPGPSAWLAHHWDIVGALVVIILLEGALIGGLLLSRRQRRRAQAVLAERLRFEALVSDVITTCTTAPLDHLDDRIRDCLRRVATFLELDRGALWQRGPEATVLSVTHVWQRDGTPGIRPVVDLQAFPYFRARTEGGAMVCFTTSELPPAAALERVALERIGVRSFAAIPLLGSDRALSFLTFLSLRTECRWPAHIVQQLRTLAEPFTAALIRMQSAAAIERSVAMADAVLAALPGETAIIDAAGTIVQINDAWAGAVWKGRGVEPALKVGANYLEACRSAVDMPPDSAAKVHASLAAILRAERDEFALEYPTSRGEEDRWFEVRVRRLARFGGGAAVMRFDVTARRHAEAAAQRHLAHIAHLDRVAGMGQLASSLAHELNQPLTGILANAQAAKRLLRLSTPDLEELRACVGDIISDDRRASEVIRRMWQLLKRADVISIPLALNELAANTIRLVANSAVLHAVTIQFMPTPALPVAYGDSAQIQQVILNLLTNAITAAANDDGAPGRVIVWTAVVTPQYVELGVRDSGRGIAEEDLSRIFEPFFTTKRDGLGMGLTVSRTIVDAHGGRLLAENDPSGGAVFRVLLRTDQPGTI